MTYNHLFQPYDLGENHLKNRFVMAPMTRSRSTQPGHVPNSLMAEYYAQRSSAGHILTEATQISLQGKGYAKTPGIYTQERIEGWKLITDAVYKGSKIFLQIWHVGRVSSLKYLRQLLTGSINLPIFLLCYIVYQSLDMVGLFFIKLFQNYEICSSDQFLPPKINIEF